MPVGQRWLAGRPEKSHGWKAETCLVILAPTATAP